MNDEMPLQNRMTPEGEIVATSARGLFMGNRGQLHGAERAIGAKRWTVQAWISCELSFGGRCRTLMAPGHYTELFFLDEAVALAAGHRPCGECRRSAHRAFRKAWTTAHGANDLSIRELDRRLHHSRIKSRTREQIRHWRPIDALPDGVFVALPGAGGAWLVVGDQLYLYAPEGYRTSTPRPSGRVVEVLTPSVTVDVLAAGYRPVVHPSAAAANRGAPSPLPGRALLWVE